jgi:hypothetical protein
MPIPRVKPTGVTAIATMLGAVTVTEVDWETPPSEAEMLVEPAESALTTPELETVATAVDEDAHVTSAVKSALLPSL